jgi:hypothetical protein
MQATHIDNKLLDKYKDFVTIRAIDDGSAGHNIYFVEELHRGLYRYFSLPFSLTCELDFANIHQIKYKVSEYFNEYELIYSKEERDFIVRNFEKTGQYIHLFPIENKLYKNVLTKIMYYMDAKTVDNFVLYDYIVKHDFSLQTCYNKFEKEFDAKPSKKFDTLFMKKSDYTSEEIKTVEQRIEYLDLFDAINKEYTLIFENFTDDTFSYEFNKCKFSYSIFKKQEFPVTQFYLYSMSKFKNALKDNIKEKEERELLNRTELAREVANKLKIELESEKEKKARQIQIQNAQKKIEKMIDYEKIRYSESQDLKFISNEIALINNILDDAYEQAYLSYEKNHFSRSAHIFMVNNIQYNSPIVEFINHLNGIKKKYLKDFKNETCREETQLLFKKLQSAPEKYSAYKTLIDGISPHFLEREQMEEYKGFLKKFEVLKNTTFFDPITKFAMNICASASNLANSIITTGINILKPSPQETTDSEMDRLVEINNLLDKIHNTDEIRNIDTDEINSTQKECLEKCENLDTFYQQEEFKEMDLENIDTEFEKAMASSIANPLLDNQNSDQPMQDVPRLQIQDLISALDPTIISANITEIPKVLNKVSDECKNIKKNIESYRTDRVETFELNSNTDIDKLFSMFTIGNFVEAQLQSQLNFFLTNSVKITRNYFIFSENIKKAIENAPNEEQKGCLASLESTHSLASYKANISTRDAIAVTTRALKKNKKNKKEILDLLTDLFYANTVKTGAFDNKLMFKILHHVDTIMSNPFKHETSADYMKKRIKNSDNYVKSYMLKTMNIITNKHDIERSIFTFSYADFFDLISNVKPHEQKEIQAEITKKHPSHLALLYAFAKDKFKGIFTRPYDTNQIKYIDDTDGDIVFNTVSKLLLPIVKGVQQKIQEAKKFDIYEAFKNVKTSLSNKAKMMTEFKNKIINEVKRISMLPIKTLENYFVTTKINNFLSKKRSGPALKKFSDKYYEAYSDANTKPTQINIKNAEFDESIFSNASGNFYFEINIID